MSCVPSGKRISTSAITAPRQLARSRRRRACATSRPFDPNQRWARDVLDQRLPRSRSDGLASFAVPPAGTRRSRAGRASAGTAASRSAGSSIGPSISSGTSPRTRRGRARPPAPSGRGCGRTGRCRPRSADVREDPRVLRAQRLVRAEPEHRMLLAQRDEAVEPAQERGRRAELRLDVHRPGSRRPGPSAAAGRAARSRRARSRRCGRPSTASACGRRRGRRGRRCRPSRSRPRSRGPGAPGSENRIACISSISSRPLSSSGREPAADPEVELHPRVLRVLGVHVVALLVGDHLERQLVVVAQEEAPLRVVGDRRRPVEDLVDRRRLLAADAP